MVTRYGVCSVGIVGCDIRMPTPSEHIDGTKHGARMAFSQLAMLGMTLLGLYEFAPFLLDEGSLPEWVGSTSGPVGWLRETPWVKVSAVTSLVPYGVVLSKRIPKKVGIPKILKGSWLVPIGKTHWGKWVYFNFSGVVPHSIIAGSTKFGKTAFLKLILYILCQQQPPTKLQIMIVDLKGGASFGQWKHLPHVIDVKRSLDGAEEVLQAAEAEMWRRLNSIDEARMRFDKPPGFPHLFVVIDEGSLLKMSDDCMKHLQNIAAIGREPHVHILYGTQRPSHEILPVVIRDSMEGRFVFNLNEPGSSRVALGDQNTDAYRFSSRPGRMIHLSPDGQKELQAAYVDNDTIEAWLRTFADLPIDVEWTEDKEDAVGGRTSSSSSGNVIEFVRRE